MQGKAGAAAITSNDLLTLNQFGQLHTAQVSDYAAVSASGASAVAAITVSSYAPTLISRKETFISPVDGSVFVVSTASGGAYGAVVSKFSAAGALIGSISLENQTYTSQSFIISQLSNGNLVVSWSTTGTATLNFAIIDINLLVVVSKTVISTAIADPHYDQIPLSGGGFAVIFTGTADGRGYLAIYNNTGAVTSAVSAISGGPTSYACAAMAQLSNGNIAIAINSMTASRALGHAICSAAGASVLAYTVLDSASSSVGAYAYPRISALPGFYCCSTYDGANCVTYVLNNAGTLQGGALTQASTNNSTANTQLSQLINDGTGFWLVSRSQAPDIFVTYIPTSGTGFVTTDTGIATASVVNIDCFIERGFLVMHVNPSSIYVYKINATFNIYGLNTIALGAAPFSVASAIKATGDFTVMLVTNTTTTSWGIVKYMNTAIVDIAQSSIAAGNAGTLLNYSEGPGGFLCNTLLGSVGKAFDNSATTIIGNKGTMLGNSVTLKGI